MAAAAMVIDQNCVADINALLESKKPVNQIVDQVVAVLQKHGLAHYQAGVTPSQVLCHPHNRAKQMISWLDMWAKGQQMLAIGMKRQLLGESMAMELSIDPAKREQQINANKAIIQEAAGYLSLSASHTTAFLRAIQHGCTPESGQAIEVPRDDPAWDLIQNGWQWLIFSHLVEKQWPMLPSLLQGALNSANAISKAPNELELAAQLANLFQHGVALKEAKKTVQATTIVDPQLLEDLCHFVTHYAGGRNFNIQLQVGHDIFQAMCYTNFKVSGQVFPMLRIAMWAAMLCTQKHQDNIQKLLVKGDIDRLKTQSNLVKVQLAEDQLQASWKVAIAKPDQEAAMKCFGKMCVRTILFLVGKQKFSREAKTYKDLAEIVVQFTTDMAGTSTIQAEEDKPQIPKDVMSAKPADVALLQNPHMKKGELQHGIYFES
eukprot:s4693_g4.t1